ncbi:MAG: response regulator [Deltaproteobacteria bacterium]|jgi:two-component system chemotaxis response regulator CheY|nr:response regulator [Deltaproteobacteria bacterium]
MKVLIIDDSRAARMVISRIMQNIGFETIEAGNGKEALEKLHATPEISICMVDWNMPVMNGYEFICEVRKDQIYTDLKLMMVTTENEASQILKALAAGVDEYVMKPFTDEVIIDKLSFMGLA